MNPNNAAIANIGKAMIFNTLTRFPLPHIDEAPIYITTTYHTTNINE